MSSLKLTLLGFISLIIFSSCSSDSSIANDWKAVDDNVFHGPADPDNTGDARGSYVWMNNRMNEEQVADQLNTERPYDTVGQGGDDTGEENMSFQP
ncbi:MAG TPA: hypothetical protein DD381_10140 [Lentisphaeria bacterium]|nr:MAG: hypothetical protein A2X47_11915 [Lentisphaerae bacterium GWF2_38_69]HBM16684.1 hypothetical protein [Lentisphaeria bacterium]